MSDWRIPLSDLDYGPEEEAAALEVVRSKWLTMGPQVQAFEQEFARNLGVEHAFAVANATAALHLAYLALGLGPGDEIIQPAINFVAAANMTVAAGARPVFGDIVSLREPILDPAEVERLLTLRTKAVVVMYYGGYFGPTAELRALCRDRGVAFIEDACHAVGARCREAGGNMAGNLGDVGCFSFFGNKNVSTGEGGMVVTNRGDLAERLRLLRSHGMTTLTWDRHRGHASTYDVHVHGYNYRLDELHAVLGRVQLRKLAANNERRHQRVLTYRRLLAELPGWTVPFAHTEGDSAYHLMVTLAPDGEQRARAARALKEAKIQTSLHYPCITDFTAFAPHGAAAVPKSRLFARRAITLPLYPGLTDAQVGEVVSVLAAASPLAASRGSHACE
jgi:dTDP-4-amino-4,6-dideoxygalactose transaminase